VAEPPQHCAQSVEELKRRGDRRSLYTAPGLGDPESGPDFLGAARGDAVVVHAILARTLGVSARFRATDEAALRICR